MLAPPPPFVVFPDAARFLSAARKEFESAELNALEALIAAELPPVTSVRSLALLFGVSPTLIVAMVRNPNRYYRTFEIPAGRKKRTINTPKIALKVIQRWFGFHLGRRIEVAPHVHGFVPERSTVTAARAHCPSSWVLSMDIRDFFGSVTVTRVGDSLKQIGYPSFAAHLLAELTTLPIPGGRGLPQGAPSSPVLANLAFRKTDEALSLLARDKRLRLTRYADDLSFSGDDEPDEGVSALVEQLLVAHGWFVAPHKTRIVRLPQNHPSVLGLLVSDESPRLPKKYRNRLRMMRYLLKNKDLEAGVRNRLMGHVAYAQSVT